MKNILSILALFAFTTLNAATFNTVTLTVTNGTVNGRTITVNGSVRTFTNAVALPSSQILTNATIGGTVTNVFNHFGTYKVAGVNDQISATNIVKFFGSGLVVSVSSGWATVSSSSSTSTNVYAVTVPFDPMADAEQTNVPSLLVLGLNSNSQAAIDQTSVLASQLVGTNNDQTIGGAKFLIGINTYSNASQQWIGGTVSAALGRTTNGYLTNAILDNPRMTNAVNRGAAFSSSGTAANSEQIGAGASATGELSSAFGPSALATGIAALAVGYDAQATNDSAVAIGSSRARGVGATAVGVGAVAQTDNSSAFGSGSTALGTNSVAIGVQATTQLSHTNSVAIGYGSQTTGPNQVMLGSADSSTVVPNILYVRGSFTNPTLTGTFTNQADTAFTREDNTSLANGANSGVVVTNVYVKVSGPTAAFSINGIAGGRDGRIVTIQNSTGYAMTIANDSGLDSTAANRIYTGSGSDIAVSANPGVVTLIYDASASRWVLKSYPPLSQTVEPITGILTNDYHATVNDVSILFKGIGATNNLIYLPTNAVVGQKLEISLLGVSFGLLYVTNQTGFVSAVNAFETVKAFGMNPSNVSGLIVRKYSTTNWVVTIQSFTP